MYNCLFYWYFKILYVQCNLFSLDVLFMQGLISLVQIKFRGESSQHIRGGGSSPFSSSSPSLLSSLFLPKNEKGFRRTSIDFGEAREFEPPSPQVRHCWQQCTGSPTSYNGPMVTAHTDSAGTRKVHPMMALKPTVCADSTRAWVAETFYEQLAIKPCHVTTLQLQ